MNLRSARIEARNTIILEFHELPRGLKAGGVSFAPPLAVRSSELQGGRVAVRVDDLDLSVNYTVMVHGQGNLPVDVGAVLSTLKSDKDLGCQVRDGAHLFRVFAPRARRVILHVFGHFADAIGTRYTMEKDEDGVWELSVSLYPGARYYAYSVDGPAGKGEFFRPTVLIADPYAPASITRNDFRHEARTPLPEALPEFDWGDDVPVRLSPEDLIIAELHVGDVTRHASSGVDDEHAGSYAALAKQESVPFQHLLRLGINAVEFLPLQQYAYFEPPYRELVSPDIHNTWNPYARNHWGYMTSLYFSPEPRFASGSLDVPDSWNDVGLRQVSEFKQLVRSFHSHGIAVIMDVVYNHTSQYDHQPLKYLDRKYYYTRDEQGTYRGASGCGNDLATARPMARRLIVDSVLHWMKEYHVDGFRFDLAAMIDRKTLVAIRDAARALNPDVILIAEPWGGGAYDPAGFSSLDMQSWNDIFRNGVKGAQPETGPGYIFGSWGDSNPMDFGKWMLGCVEEYGGPFRSHHHAVNYLESHDGYTLADFIRIALKESPGEGTLSPEALRISRLAAVILLTARGAIMLQAGQEFGRGKIVAPRDLPDISPGTFDHNSYEKDDETNWLDWTLAERNRELLEYYRGLIALRRTFGMLRKAGTDSYMFLSTPVNLSSGVVVHGGTEGDIAVLLNPGQSGPARFELPYKGEWSVVVDAVSSGVDELYRVSGRSVVVPAGTAMVLWKPERARAD